MSKRAGTTAPDASSGWRRSIVVCAAVLVIGGMLLGTGCGDREPAELSLDVAGGKVTLQPVTESFGERDAEIRCHVTGDALGPHGRLVLVHQQGERWREIPMQLATQTGERGAGDAQAGSGWSAAIPHAGRGKAVAYYVRVDAGLGRSAQTLPAGAPASTLSLTFKGEVSRPVLLAHVLFMMGGLLPLFASLILAIIFLCSARGLGALRWLVLIGFICLVIGTLPLGIAVEYQVFGTYWEGWPFGRDVTDTKSGFLLLVWLVLLLARGREPAPSPSPEPRRRDRIWARWVVVLVLLTIAIYLIPHENLKF